VVATGPAKRLSVGLDLDTRGVDALAPKELQGFRGKVTADDADDADRLYEAEPPSASSARPKGVSIES